MPTYNSHQDLLLYILWKVWEQGWQTREILPQISRTGEGSSCCCEKDAKLDSYPSLRKKKKRPSSVCPSGQVETPVVGEKANKISCNYEGIRDKGESGTQTIKSLLHDIFNTKNYEIHKKARKIKNSPLSRDKAINRTRLRNDLDVLLIIQGI